MVPQRITLLLGEELAEIMAHSRPHFLCPNDLGLEDMNWDLTRRAAVIAVIAHCLLLPVIGHQHLSIESLPGPCPCRGVCFYPCVPCGNMTTLVNGV